ncbi:MAG TPA: hypothetical protein VLT85_01460 [Terriglobales bacterium]|nr:hypothetical protein [Terriglobales bacterium]
MRLSIKGMALASGLLWGGCLLCLGLINLAAPSYGAAFLQMMSSVYPGFHFSRSVGDVLVGGGYGLVDGGIAGLILAWLYNLCAGRGGKA